MKGTDQIFFMLFIGYIVFTTMRGNLRKWLEVIGLREAMTKGRIFDSIMLRGQE